MHCWVLLGLLLRLTAVRRPLLPPRTGSLPSSGAGALAVLLAWTAVPLLVGDDPRPERRGERRGPAHRGAPVNGGRPLFTEADEGGQVEYRLEKPVVGEAGGEISDTGNLESLAATTQLPDPDCVAVSPELFAAVQAGEDDPAALLVCE